MPKNNASEKRELALYSSLHIISYDTKFSQCVHYDLQSTKTH